MNATEMGRRSDSLYYDNVSRRELCDRIAHLESDLEEAKGKETRYLIEDMLSCIEIQIAFGSVPEKWMYEEFAKRATELGIEVD